MSNSGVRLGKNGVVLRTGNFGGPMTSATATDEVGIRIAEWLRSVYPKNGASLAAQKFDASIETAKKWFTGVRPSNRHFDEMSELWGWRFIAHVYQWAPPPREDELDAELEDLKQRMARFEGLIKGNTNGAGLAQ